MKIRSRYDQIAAKLREEYPVASSDYLHVREEMMKERVASKLKRYKQRTRRPLMQRERVVVAE